MTTRGQILRSSTPGQVPAAGTRQPGELWTTFPDLQLGVIDASKNAQRLVAVRYFSTTANYAAGDFVVQAGVLYAAKGAVAAGAFNATQWTQVAAATDAGGPYLPIVGGTLTGALVLNADPGAALGAATKQYVDGKVGAAPFLPLAGGTMLAPITLSGPPTTPLHAATKAYVDAGAFVPIAGGTMTGPLILNANPSANLGAVPKQYVDALPVAMNDNRLVNGDMRIDARNNGASGTAISVYTVDRWTYAATQASKGTWQRVTPAPSAPGFPYALSFTSSSAYASLTTDQFCFQQPVEADMVSDFQWGTANAQPVILSFWAYVNQTGTFSGAIINYAATRSYPFTYSIPSVNTWTKIVVPIPGDTAGAWTMSGSAGALYVRFDLGSGANFRGPANVWAAANYIGVTGSVSLVGVNGAGLFLTGVKLEIGSVATSYNRQSLAKSQADCERYFRWCGFNQAFSAVAGFLNMASSLSFLAMRASPTASVVAADPNTTPQGSNLTADVIDSITPYSVRIYTQATAVGAAYITGYRFSLSAEL